MFNSVFLLKSKPVILVLLQFKVVKAVFLLTSILVIPVLLQFKSVRLEKNSIPFTLVIFLLPLIFILVIFLFSSGDKRPSPSVLKFVLI